MERISIFKVKYISQIVDYPSKEFDKYSSKIRNLFRVREPSKTFDFSILGKCKLLLLKMKFLKYDLWINSYARF